MTNLRSLRIPVFCLLTSVFCLGKGEDVRTKKQSADELPASLVHAVGAQKINQLLHNPLDTAQPGLFIEDMLYLLAKSDIPKLIRFVRDVDAARILRLTYNIKRLGCNKTVPALNVLLPPSYNRCTLETFNHLDILVRMVNGTNDIGQLVQIVNQVSFGTALSTQDAYLEKLAYLIVYIGSVDKVFQLLNGIIDTRDIIFFIDRLDPELSDMAHASFPANLPPASIGEIQAGSKLGNMDSVLRILVKLNDGNKIFELMNGVRPIGGNDTTQQAYLVNLTTVMQSIETEAGRSCPNDTGITTLAALINNLINAVSLVNLIEQLNPNNVAALVNRVAKTSQHTIALPEPIVLPPATGSTECAGRTDLEAGGKKVAAIMNEVNQVQDLIYLINNLHPNPLIGVQALGDMIGRLNVDDAHKLGKLLNDVLPAFDSSAVPWTNQLRYAYNATPPTNRQASKGVGKVVNLLNGLDSGGSLVKLINNITDGTKLPTLLNQTTNSSNLVGFLNAILRTPSASFNDLVEFINIMDNTTGIPRLIQLIENLTAATETATVINPSTVHLDVAALMAPQTGTVMTDNIGSSGIGTGAMALLLNTLTNITGPDGKNPVQRLIDILNGTAANFAYNSAIPNIPRKEALVRIIAFGVRKNPVGFNYQFPALGPKHLSSIINDVNATSNLLGLLNSTGPYTNIADIVPLIACFDRLVVAPQTSPSVPHYIAYGPGTIDFQPHCAAVNMGW
jgi:hypothetical protein